MRQLDQYGYASLFLGLTLFYGFEFFTVGLFFQGMALGFFGKSAYDQVTKKKR